MDKKNNRSKNLNSANDQTSAAISSEMNKADAEVSKLSDVNGADNSVTILKNILNSINAYLYVSDTVTDEILFVNDNMKKVFNITGDGTGRQCWKVFQQGFNARCEFCPCYKLDKDPDKTIEWEEHNTVTGRYYRNTDRYIEWYGGKKVHLQHSVDITDIKTAQINLDARLKQQALMTSITQSFLSVKDVDALINNTLRRVGEFTGISQALFYKPSVNKSSYICVNEWISPDTGLHSRVGEEMAFPEKLMSGMEKLFVNQKFYLSSDELIEKKVIAPYRKNFLNYLIAPVFLKNKPFAFLDFSVKDTDKKWSESEISLMTFVSSLLSGFIERNLAEDQLKLQSSIIEASSHPVLNITASGQINYANPAARAFTGHSTAELLEDGLEKIFGHATATDIKEKYIPKTLSEGTDSFEVSIVDNAGRNHIMAFSSFIAGNNSADVACIANDLTEIRKLESELISAKELAETGSRSKSEFLSRMSHEMRTPMNAIIGMTHIARNSKDVEKKEYCLEKINNASRHLLGVINDVLDVSKIEANKFEINSAEFSFERMLMSILNIINFRLEEKMQSFNFYLDPSMPQVFMGDEHRLTQVIMNLLSNAVKFTPEKGNIALSTKIIDIKNGTYTLQIEIADSGIGMSPEQQRKIFRPFEQADGSIARKFGGTGLGLVISKNIINLMGGKIWIESELDKGSKFIFTVKLTEGKPAVIKQKINLNELSVLAVDDTPEINDYFKHLMDNMNIACTVVSSGTEALECIKNAKKPFDIIFLDWKMSEMDGIELTEKIRSIYGEKPIIIMISVSEWSEIEKRAIAAGVNGFVPKPLFPSMLLDCINKHLNISQEIQDIKNEPTENLFAGKTVLIAEDIDINREIIVTVLENTALKIDCAENGRRVVEMFGANPSKYDMILMDIHMPEIDGLEATRRIRSLGLPESSQVPIVAMTADVFHEDIEKCMAAGMDDHIGKPINFDELMLKLKLFLEN